MREAPHCDLAWVQGDNISSVLGNTDWLTGATGLCVLAQPPFPSLQMFT